MLSVLVAATANWSVAVAVAVVATLVLVGLIAALVSVIRAARALRLVAEDLSRQSERLLVELGGTLRDANAELERVDGLVDTAEDLTETLTAASQAAYLTVAKPLIKVLAFRRGTARAVEYWRSGLHPGRLGRSRRHTTSGREVTRGRDASRRGDASGRRDDHGGRAARQGETGQSRLASAGLRRTPDRSRIGAGERPPSERPPAERPPAPERAPADRAPATGEGGEAKEAGEAREAGGAIEGRPAGEARPTGTGRR